MLTATLHDLHSHSLYSDGTLSPRDLVARAARRGVTMLALTDHDETGGLAEAREAAQEYGITLVDGVEISVTWHGHTLHVVGLGIDPGDAGLQTGLAATCGGRVERARRMAAAFDELGIADTFEGAQQFAANPRLIGRAHFARLLVQRGVVKDMNAAFKRFLGAGQPCNVPLQWAALDDAVQWIRGSGGLAVIAHPGRYPLDNALMHTLLGEFAELGGAALEVVSGSQKPSQYSAFAQLARHHGLAASAGSDFHSPQESQRDLGGLPALPAGCTPVWGRWH